MRLNMFTEDTRIKGEDLPTDYKDINDYLLDKIDKKWREIKSSQNDIIKSLDNFELSIKKRIIQINVDTEDMISCVFNLLGVALLENTEHKYGGKHD